MSPERPIRVTVVLSHPVQYFAPWFRHIARHRPELDLTVLYAAIPTPEQQGVGFDRAFSWDIPLTDGYRYEVCGDAAGKRFDSDHFLGIDMPRIGARIAGTHPDVVLVPGWHSVMQVRALRACRRLGIPVLYRGDSTLASGPRKFIRPLWRLKTRTLLRWFDGYLAVGTGADEYLRRFHALDPLIFRSPHCVENERFAADSDEARASGDRDRARAGFGASPADFVVCFAGKCVDRKQPLAAVRAVAGLGSGAVLLMIGDGPLADAARTEAARLGVRLAWRGFLNQSELPRAYASADCTLMPSTWESWGLVVNESLASGVPCVATSGVEAVRDLIVDGTTGYTVPVGDVAAMTARLNDIRVARANGRDFARDCRARVARASFDAATDGLVAASRRVLAHRAHTPAAAGSPRVVALCGDMVMLFGRERMTFEVLRTLRDHGAAVHCIVNTWSSGDIVALAESMGASWSTGRYWETLKRRGWSIRDAVLAVWDVAATSGGLLRDVRRMRATHVLVASYHSVLRNWPALLALRLAGVSVIFRVPDAPDAGEFYRRLWRWLINPAVGRFVVNSQFTAGEMRRVGIAPDKLHVIANTQSRRQPSDAAAAPREAPAARTPHTARLIYVGQMIPPKGLDLLLDATGLLVAKGYDVELDAVGDIDGWEPPGWEGYRTRLRARAAQPDLADRVCFLGVRDDVPGLLAAATLHCCPSRMEKRESFGGVTVEAKLAGIPSVVTPSGGLPELIDHPRNGWIAAADTAEALAEGIAYFLDRPAALKDAAAAARASAEDYSRSRFVAAWLPCFDVDNRTMHHQEGAADRRAAHSHVR